MERVTVEVATRRRRLSDEIKDLYQRTRTWSKYPQGFMTRYRSNIIDNLDAAHTLIQKIIIPKGVVAVNSVKLSSYGHKFRAYESGAEAGGAQYLTSNPSTMSVTTDQGTRANTDLTTPADTTTSQPTPDATQDESSHTHRVSWNWFYSDGYYLLRFDASIPRIYSTYGGYMELQAFTYSYLGDVYHQHPYDHSHQTQGAQHSHAIDHYHQVPGSSHQHNVQLQDHVHSLVYGIYEEASAGAAISLTITDPAGNNYSIGSLGSGEFAKEDLQLKEYFTQIGVYTLTFTADDLARIMSIIECDLVIESE